MGTVSISNIYSFDEESVLESLSGLKLTYLPGPDGVPACILRKCAVVLSGPLTFIFNGLLRAGHFPSIWKSSFIIPLHKSGNKSNISNYRGIAKLSAIPKLMEKLVTDYLFFNTRSLISPFQHGFLKGRSTVTNLLEFTTHVFRGFLARARTDVIYTDFSKAFDRVDHRILLLKLSLIGIPDIIHRWLDSYLSLRTQRVLFRNVLSKTVYVTSGVPQGSHLGPLLFLLFLNDLPCAISDCNILMYADDVKLFYTFDDDHGQAVLQRNIDLFVTWCRINLMDLNLRKCKCMVFSRGGVISSTYVINSCPLETVTTFLDLGVLLDMKLSFIDHISMMIGKARAVLGFVKRWAREFIDPYITRLLYISLVRPILEYASIIWNPYYRCHSDSIESVQKQFLLFCLRGLGWDYANGFPSYEARLGLIKLPTLERRRTVLGVCFVFNLVKGDIDSEFLLCNLNFSIPARFSRHYRPLSLDFYRTNYGCNFPFRRLCNDFNLYYDFIDFNCSVCNIKRSLYAGINL